uniref:Phosphatidylinositol 3,4,5-trisphosphate 3-phosphatase and dual-specificity protein phosphatase PTEN n=1 Tax=Bactrocera dorsalis TaxID=27457 RepID=A0A6J0RG01_BACDO
MSKQGSLQNCLINAQTAYYPEKKLYPKLQQQQKLVYLSKYPRSCRILTFKKFVSKKISPAKVTVTEKLRESERICGAASSGININKFKHKMANTLSVMTNVLRNVVSKQRIRYKDNGYNLDLTYIYDNIIAMGYPADNIESIFRNRLEDVYKFLQEVHQNHYKIYNLCLERSYDSNKFHGRVAVYPFEDHNPPTIELIQKFCMDVDEWLKADKKNVAAVHCKAGKGRTGTMICCYMLFSGRQKTAEDALECYAEKRTKDLKGVTIPSQRRYVQYFAKLIQSGVPYERRILQFCEIRFTEANLLHSYGTVHCSISVLEDDGCSVKVKHLLGLPIDFRKSHTLDLKNLCVAGDIKVELTHKKKLFHFWFNTYFVRDDAVVEGEGEDAKLVYTLNKCEIDDAHKDKEHKCFSEGFKVQLVFYAETSMRPGLQANVSSIASHNQRMSQNARLSHQSSGGGCESSSSSNCQLPQNSSSGSDLNYICDQKSSSSASASVSSLGGPLVGGGGGVGGGNGSGSGSGSIGELSMGDTTNADFSRMDSTLMGAQYIQHQQQLQHQQKQQICHRQKYNAAKNINSDCDVFDCNTGMMSLGRTHAAPTNTYALLPQQQQQHEELISVNNRQLYTATKNVGDDCDDYGDGDVRILSFERINVAPTTAYALQPQQHHAERISVNYRHQYMPANNISGDCDVYDCDVGVTPFARLSTAPTTFALPPQQQQDTQSQHTYVNLEHMMTASDKQQLMQHYQQQPPQQLMKPLFTTAPNHVATTSTVVTATGNNVMKFGVPSTTMGLMCGKNILYQPAVVHGDGNTNHCANSVRRLDEGTRTTMQTNGSSGGSEVNGCISANSSKSSISSQTSSSESTTSCSSSSAPTSGGDKDCEEEDWESGECHPKMPHTVVPKALQLSTLLATSKPSTANNTTTTFNNTNSSFPNITTTTITHTSLPSTATITTHTKHISTSISQQPSTFYMNININSGSYNCSYCGCDDDENNTNLKYECKHIQEKEKLQKTNFTTNERRSSCAAVKLNGDTESVFRSNENTNKFSTEVRVSTVAGAASSLSASRKTHTLIAPKKYDATVGNSKHSHMSNVSNVVSSWTQKPIFQQKFNTKKCSELSSAAIAVKKSNAYGTSAMAIGTDTAMLALSCSPASGCSGLASTSRRKLKNKLKNNTKKLSHWLQNHFRANPVEFCENFVQHTTAIRRNSNCSVSSRSRKLSMSSTTVSVTPGSSLPKRQLLVPPKLMNEKCVVVNSEGANAGTYDIYGEMVENALKDESLAAEPAAVNLHIVSVNGVVGEARTKISLSEFESTTASNVSLSTVGGSTERSVHGGSGSSDTFEDFYSSNCDNQLSFNNSPCKSPRSLVDIAGSSAYSATHQDLYATSLNERNVHLQMKREQHMLRHMNVQSLGQPQHNNHHQLHQLNVVVVAAKPAKTHAIGFNVTKDRTTENYETFAHEGNAVNIQTANKNRDEAASANQLNASDMSIGANVTIITTEEDEKIIELQECVNVDDHAKGHLSRDRLAPKFDSFDEIEEDNEDGATTGSSVYFTPKLTTGIGDDVIDGTATEHYPFVFPNVQNELNKLSMQIAGNKSDLENEVSSKCHEQSSKMPTSIITAAGQQSNFVADENGAVLSSIALKTTTTPLDGDATNSKH